MDADLGDIRLLKLAEFYERAYESFVVELARTYVLDEDVRERLHGVAGGADEHTHRLADALRRKSAEVSASRHVDVERAALLDILEIERAARAFYIEHVEEVHDPEVARLFRDLAREESRHVAIVEGAIALADRRHGRVAHESAPS